MANITIQMKQGYILLDLGAYYPSSTSEAYHAFPRSSWGGICKKKIGSEEGIEFHINHETEPFNLTYTSGLTSFMQVDSVNGIVPTSLDNLRDLIIDAIN